MEFIHTFRVINVHESFSRLYAAEMSTKHVRTAADLARFKCALKIECANCGNSNTMDGFDVAKAYGTKSFAEIRPRMKCSRCGVKDAALTILAPPAPRG